MYWYLTIGLTLAVAITHSETLDARNVGWRDFVNAMVFALIWPLAAIAMLFDIISRARQCRRPCYCGSGKQRRACRHDQYAL